MYVIKDLYCKIRKYINIISAEGIFECCGCEFKMKGKLFVIVCIYRPPNGNIDDFLIKLEELLAMCVNESGVIIVAGDFNLDFLSANKKVSELLALISSFNIKHVIRSIQE